MAIDKFGKQEKMMFEKPPSQCLHPKKLEEIEERERSASISSDGKPEPQEVLRPIVMPKPFAL
eukprot:CAMPEP_0113545430 /NCGR_PEP_ID=MMETSP0015_2-20120614/11257_1 /TAXON_ID=2838 /ORGANISM="Odontella" /LENGTH=62 /DNA_ID=CAMNT_0000445795 /DNA_START=234 /DNA_END=422 /DNA_ORIENTATION=- /assembly_acc=CAM_ASM_000160